MDRSIVLAVVFLSCTFASACTETKDVDWSAKEDFFVEEKTEKTADGARMEFHSLVDAPGDAVYKALADVENYASFVDGVQETKLLSAQGNTKLIAIAQTVIGQQTRAQVKWTFDPGNRKIAFETITSDGNYNDGSYEVIPSPKGDRAYVISVFHVKAQGRQYIPIGVLESATRDSLEKAAASVKKRALATTG